MFCVVVKIVKVQSLGKVPESRNARTLRIWLHEWSLGAKLIQTQNVKFQSNLRELNQWKKNIKQRLPRSIRIILNCLLNFMLYVLCFILKINACFKYVLSMFYFPAWILKAHCGISLREEVSRIELKNKRIRRAWTRKLLDKNGGRVVHEIEIWINTWNKTN